MTHPWISPTTVTGALIWTTLDSRMRTSFVFSHISRSKTSCRSCFLNSCEIHASRSKGAISDADKFRRLALIIYLALLAYSFRRLRESQLNASTIFSSTLAQPHPNLIRHQSTWIHDISPYIPPNNSSQIPSVMSTPAPMAMPFSLDLETFDLLSSSYPKFREMSFWRQFAQASSGCTVLNRDILAFIELFLSTLIPRLFLMRADIVPSVIESWQWTHMSNGCTFPANFRPRPWGSERPNVPMLALLPPRKFILTVTPFREPLLRRLIKNL